MEPIAIVTAFVGFFIILARGIHVVAPKFGAAMFRRLLSSPSRVRLFAGTLFVLVALPLIVTARYAENVKVDVIFWIEVYGWIAGIAFALVFAFATHVQNYAINYWNADPTLIWSHSLLKVSFGVFLVWIAFIVM